MKKILILIAIITSLMVLSAATFKTDRILIKTFELDSLDASDLDSLHFRTDILSHNDSDSIAYLMEFHYLDSTSFYDDSLNLTWEIKYGYTSPLHWYLEDYDTWTEREELLANADADAQGKVFISDAIEPIHTGNIRIDGWFKNQDSTGARKLKIHLWQIIKRERR